MSVRAKFRVTEKTEHAWYGNGKVDAVTIKLAAVYSSDPNHENKAFWDATPNANLEMQINNVSAADLFHVGSEYYLDFTEAPATPA